MRHSETTDFVEIVIRCQLPERSTYVQTVAEEGPAPITALETLVAAIEAWVSKYLDQHIKEGVQVIGNPPFVELRFNKDKTLAKTPRRE